MDEHTVGNGTVDDIVLCAVGDEHACEDAEDFRRAISMAIDGTHPVVIRIERVDAVYTNSTINHYHTTS